LIRRPYLMIWKRDKKAPNYALMIVAFFGFFLLTGGINIPKQDSTVISQETSTCLTRVNISPGDAHWTYVPDTPDQLYTEEKLFFLAGQLIEQGVVDAGECPSDGLMSNGYANACGIDVAMPMVIVVQNLMNEPILQAYEDVGVPPVVLKQLISTESQFWPSEFESTHFGFGHLTNIGIRNAMQWNPDLYNKVCPSSDTGSCLTSYGAAEQILASLVSTCEDCEYGIDIQVANRSIDILAESLLGFCFQTERLVYNTTGWYSGYAVDYATIWKLTLMDYNAGSQCVYNTLKSTFDYTNGPMRWPDISAHVSGDMCVRGLQYANTITARVFDFPPSE
jgi:hypothetical protein